MSTETKRLYRSLDQRMVAGVCGGLGEYLNTDPTVIRILFVILAILGFGFGGLIVYLAMWLIVPEEPYPSEQPADVEVVVVEQSTEEPVVEQSPEEPSE